jgi:CheY-like chemotaxis protein
MSMSPELKILYAEDESLTRMLMVRQLRNHFGTVFEAANGQQAFDIFSSSYPDVVVTDLSMPVMDGFQLIRKIKSSENPAKIIVTTAFREETELLTGCEILFKPITFNELIQTITRLVSE